MKRRALVAGGVAVWVGGVYALGGEGDTEANDGSERSAGEDNNDDIGTRGESDGIGGDSTAAFEPEAVEAAIVQHINDERFAAGVPNLGRDSGLRLAAREHSKDMHGRDFYAHRNPDGEMPWHRAHCVADETIHHGYVDEIQNVDSDVTWDARNVGEAAAYVVEGWALSPPHYDAMTNNEYAKVGVGVIERGGEFLVTAKYC